MIIGHCEHTTAKYDQHICEGVVGSSSVQGEVDGTLLTSTSMVALPVTILSLGKCSNHCATDCHYWMVIFEKQCKLSKTKILPHLKLFLTVEFNTSLLLASTYTAQILIMLHTAIKNAGVYEIVYFVVDHENYHTIFIPRISRHLTTTPICPVTPVYPRGPDLLQHENTSVHKLMKNQCLPWLEWKNSSDLHRPWAQTY